LAQKSIRENFFVQNFRLRTLDLLKMSDYPPEQAAENYLVLLNQHEKALCAYVYTLVHDRHDAEDIIQNCKLTMWKQFAHFEPGSHFQAWSRKIALHQILNYRRSAKRKPLYSMDPAFIEAVAAEIDRSSDHLSARTEALQSCLKELPRNQHQIILMRYYDEAEISEIASMTKRTEAAVYRLLSRVRAILNECVKERMNAPTA
jgi:RNA polymerase sigma-70 factor (ECF subfamily)